MEKKKLYKKYFKVIIVSFMFLIWQNLFSQTLDNTNTSTTNLEALNLINVTIGGDFPLSGSYPASRTERVDQFITRILEQYKAELFKVTPDEKILSMINQNADKVAKRNIVLKRFSGEKINIDLLKFRVTGDFTYNPYLQNDDVIIFPPLDLERNFISITGAVNKETKFEFVEGDKLSDALLFAQGYNKAYPKIERIEISRLSYDGNKEKMITLFEGEDCELMPGDRIKVISEETYRRDYKVLIVGEVNQPGYIPISKSSTTINEVIEKAGGLLPDAWKEKIQVYKGYYAKLKSDDNLLFDEIEIKKLEDYQKFEELLMSRMSNLLYYDTSYFNLENQFQFFNPNGIITYNQMIKDTSDIYEIEDGDFIMVPKFKNSIFVIGQTPHPGEYKFVEGKNYLDYVKEAGGFSDYSTEDVMLVKGTTREWIPIYETESKIEPGDYIYIPKERLVDFGFYLSRVGAIASIIGTVATIVLLINQFK